MTFDWVAFFRNVGFSTGLALASLGTCITNLGCVSAADVLAHHEEVIQLAEELGIRGKAETVLYADSTFFAGYAAGVQNPSYTKITVDLNPPQLAVGSLEVVD